jgi:hypothetical protein
MTQLPAALAIGTIDAQGELTLNWQPAAVDGSYAAYADWNIWITTNNGEPQLQYVGGKLPTGLEPTGATPDSREFLEDLGSGEFQLNMQALASSGYSNSASFSTALAFPTSINPLLVTFDQPDLTYDLQQPVLITLDGSYNGATMWRILYQDGTQTGWMPLAVRSVATTFSVPGNQTLTVQFQNDYSLLSPPVQLRRELDLSVYIESMVYNPVASSQSSLTGDLGLGGNAGFEISTSQDATQGGQFYAVVVRALARDTVTGELKLLIATSRTTDASSLYGTMAVDVFPIVGRPRVKELVKLPAALKTLGTTSALPVEITISTLPTMNVGLPSVSFPMTATNGTAPYMWYAEGLPKGVKLGTDGTLSGTPLELGTYSVSFVVMDSSTPAFITTTTLPLTVQTNLSITSTTLPAATVASSIHLEGCVWFPSCWSIHLIHRCD